VSVESPAKNYPQIFGKFQLFIDYPYLLPCAVASTATLFGAILSLGLSYDGGSRWGAIRLSPDKENVPLPLSTVEEEPPPSPPRPTGIVADLKRKASRRFSDVLARRVFDGSNTNSPRLGALLPGVPGTPPKSRRASRTSKVNGSAYGYSGRAGSRLNSMNARRPSFASTLRQRQYTNPNPDQTPGTPQGFAQRLLLGMRFSFCSVSPLTLFKPMK
jgi:hypothetical protein